MKEIKTAQNWLGTDWMRDNAANTAAVAALALRSAKKKSPEAMPLVKVMFKKFCKSTRLHAHEIWTVKMSNKCGRGTGLQGWLISSSG